MTRLGLWYLFKLVRAGADLRTAAASQTPIYRLTVLWDRAHHPAGGWTDERWEDMVDRLAAACRSCSGSDEFEAVGVEILRPLTAPRVERDVRDWPWIPEGYCVNPLPDSQVFGFWAFEIPTKGDTVGLHLANPFCPESPFAEPSARAQELQEMLAAVRRNVPGARYIAATSWLNSFPPFLALLPGSWCDGNASRSSPGYGFDWWGQFVARDGGFHDRNGRAFRESGDFPYPALKGRCSLEDVENHLTNML